MNIKLKKKSGNRRGNIYRILIWVVLIVFSLIISIGLQLSDNFFQVTQNIQFTEGQNETDIPLLQKQKISGEFKAQHSNLGTVYVRFNTFNRSINDEVIFRLKEKKSNSWYYQHAYKTDQFQMDKFFSFGFPLISDSRNKTYQIELESLSGEKGNAVALSSVTPSVNAMYLFSPKMMLSVEGIEILLGKYIQSLSNSNLTLLVLSPFFLYLFIRYVVVKNVRKILILFLLFLTIAYIFLAGKILPNEQIISNNIEFLIFIFWIIVIIIERVEWRIWLINAFITGLIMCFILVLFKRPDLANRSASLTYGFLLIGTIHYVIQRFTGNYFKIKFIDFLTKFFPSKFNLLPKQLKRK